MGEIYGFVLGSRLCGWRFGSFGFWIFVALIGSLVELNDSLIDAFIRIVVFSSREVVLGGIRYFIQGNQFQTTHLRGFVWFDCFIDRLRPIRLGQALHECPVTCRIPNGGSIQFSKDNYG